MFDTGGRGQMVRRRCKFCGFVGSLVCNLVAVDALQLLQINRDFPPVGGTFGVEDERGLVGGRHLSVDGLSESETRDSLHVRVIWL